MVVFASSRASWLLSLAVLGLACNGIREDPSPGDAPPPSYVGNGNSGGGGSGGGLGFAGGSFGGSSGSGLPFSDCGCASIIESNSVPVCNQCVDLAIAAGQPCESQLVACTSDTDCGLAQILLANNTCAGDPDCTAALLTGILDQDSADLLFGYYSCVCTPCAVCDASGAGGGVLGGGAPVAGQCSVTPQ